MSTPVSPSQPNSRDDLVERLRAWDHGCGKTMIVSEAAARIEELEAALRLARNRIDYLGIACTDDRHFESNRKDYLPAIDAALGIPGVARGP